MTEEAVRVAVRIRPLLPKEILLNHKVCVCVVPGSSQVVFGTDKVFSFDHAFGPTASQDELDESCVEPLVRSLVDGYNATVFCYGQTGSGKTFTLGGRSPEYEGGLIDRVAHEVFSLLGQKRTDDGVKATVQVSYIELYNEQLRDLLELHTVHNNLHIRDDEKGNTVVVGAREVDVSSAEELLNLVATGHALRQTASTAMNEHSSRSHTVLTLQLIQCSPVNNTVCYSKLRLVDLAGSERAGKVGNNRARVRERVHINTGLLALGNVMRALAELANRGNNAGTAHIPYRDSKLTRLLRDSLGGTARTLMIACISPSHRSDAETSSVLQFASKARCIRNRPGAFKHTDGKEFPENWDPRHAQVTQLQYEVQTLRELMKDTMRKEKENGRELKISDKDEKDALNIEDGLLEQKAAELRRVQTDVQKLLQENQTHLRALNEEKERNRLQTEQLINQQIIINQLRSDLMTFRRVKSGATVEAGDLGKRPHSVPLIRNHCGHKPPRRIHSSPPAFSLERVIAAFKMRNQLLLAEIEEKDEVKCPFIKRLEGNADRDMEQEEEQEDDTAVGRFRRSINRTWTSRQKKSPLVEKNSEYITAMNESPSMDEPQRAAGTEENCAKQSQTRRLRASVAQRRIHDLSVNMHMKEELIKELHKTDKDAQALDQHVGRRSDGKQVNVLTRLSLQRQKVQAEVYCSLQHMRLQRAQLQSSLTQQRQSSENNGDVKQNEEYEAGNLTVCNVSHQEQSKNKLHVSSWLEEEEEQVLLKRAELQELEEELRRREEVVLHRDTCLQQKNKLEIKKLRSSQALSQDLLHVSMQLESLEGEMKSRSKVRRNGGVTINELERERDSLKMRRDALDAQFKDNRALTAEEEYSLLELEEAIEALDAALEFKNQSIQEKQEKLAITASFSHQSQNPDPAQLCDVIRKLKELSPPAASELLIKYFNKVVFLRETERHLRLRCEELQIHAAEQEAVVRELEVAMQRVALDVDRRLTQQHREHQKNIQLLLQKLKEGSLGEAQQAVHERLQHLEKELFFYKSSSRQLKKKLRELHSDSLQFAEQPAHLQEHKKTHTSTKSQTQSEEVQARTHIVTTYTKIHAEQTDRPTLNECHVNRSARHTPCPSASSDLQVRHITKMPEYHQINTKSQGLGHRGAVHFGDCLEMAPVRVCSRDLRQISHAELQVCGSATRRIQSVLDNSTESMLEDSIEVSKNTDR